MDRCSQLTLSLPCNHSMMTTAKSTLPTALAEHVHTTTTVVFALMFLTMIVGLIGNLLIVYIVCAKPKMITVHNVHVANIAVIDILFIIVCSVIDEVGIGYIAFRDSLHDVSRGLYAAILFMQTMTFVATCGTLMVLAFERYLAIVRPLENKKLRTLKNAFYLQSIVWSVAIIFGIIAAILELNASTSGMALGFSLYSLSGFYVGLIGFILGCHAAIFLSVREDVQIEGDRVARWQLRRNFKMLRMTNMLVIAFLLCRGFWLVAGLYAHHAPRPARGPASGLSRDARMQGRAAALTIQVCARLASAVNCAVNPFIYGMLTSDFHKHLLQVIFHPFADSAGQKRRDTMESATRQSIMGTSSITTMTTRE